MENHGLFAAVLRDPTPVTPDRARYLKSAQTGSFSRADSARMQREQKEKAKSPIDEKKRPANTILNMRYLKTFMD